jgi:hypothetical protein
LPGFEGLLRRRSEPQNFEQEIGNGDGVRAERFIQFNHTLGQWRVMLNFKGQFRIFRGRKDRNMRSDAWNLHSYSGQGNFASVPIKRKRIFADNIL